MGLHRIQKLLTSNDLGLTGSHQVGVVVPKKVAMGGFFPVLPYESTNPRRIVVFYDATTNQKISINFIYYNNKLRGGTRDEFRITGIAAHCRIRGAKVDDILEMALYEDGRRTLDLVSKRNESKLSSLGSVVTLDLSGKWSVIGGI